MVSQGFFVLDELRLSAGDAAMQVQAAARVAAMPWAPDEQMLPMLVSIDDRRDVACLRRVRQLPAAGEDSGLRIQEALTPDVKRSGPSRCYRERTAVSGSGVHSYYRMAVTESGTNHGPQPRPKMSTPEPSPALAPSQSGDDSGDGLLWIGTPVASETGLLVITGHHDSGGFGEGNPGQWPLPLSRELGVRIYELAGH
jgi:hypothetical protein